jgi:putative Mg2+ transporter-C (MgtC) family protein
MVVTHLLSSIDSEIIIRIVISTSLGFVIGLERELTNKSAGLRTHMLVCLGSTVFTILSLYGFVDQSIPQNITRMQNDPSRIAAQILTGIGFIGGGAVLHHGCSVSGLTTAASLWIVASIGMAVGVGAYNVALVATILAFCVLVFIRVLERGLISKYTKKGARIKAVIVAKQEHVTEIQDWFYLKFENIMEMKINKSNRDEDQVKINFIIDVQDINPVGHIYKKIKELKNIESVTLQKIEEE